MRVFVSWSGARSQALATSMREWLPEVVEGVEVFHSDDIPKGDSWHSALTDELGDCHVGVFCVTPESLRSQWMLYEPFPDCTDKLWESRLRRVVQTGYRL